MNNFALLLIALIVLFIGHAECCNEEDMALFVFACFICIPTIIASVVGIVFNKHIIEM